MTLDQFAELLLCRDPSFPTFQHLQPFQTSGKGANRDPLLVAKTMFGITAAQQNKLIADSAAKGFWFRKQGDGYVLTLKNGSQP